MSLLTFFRTWHRKLASVLFLFFFFIAVTGLMLGWKSLFTDIIYDNPQVKPLAESSRWMSFEKLEQFAIKGMSEYTGKHFKQAESILLKPSKGIINFTFKGYYNIQVDGVSGAVVHIEQKNGGWIQDIHDGAILDKLIPNKGGISKTTYSTFIGLSLLFFTISGFYLWYKPRQLKQQKLMK